MKMGGPEGPPISLSIELFDFAGTLLAIPLTGKRFFLTLLLARFEVKRVPFYFFYDIFLLDLTLEAPQSALQGFPILEMDFCQKVFTTFRPSSRTVRETNF